MEQSNQQLIDFFLDYRENFEFENDPSFMADQYGITIEECRNRVNEGRKHLIEQLLNEPNI